MERFTLVRRANDFPPFKLLSNLFASRALFSCTAPANLGEATDTRMDSL